MYSTHLSFSIVLTIFTCISCAICVEADAASLDTSVTDLLRQLSLRPLPLNGSLTNMAYNLLKCMEVEGFSNATSVITDEGSSLTIYANSTQVNSTAVSAIYMRCSRLYAGTLRTSMLVADALDEGDVYYSTLGEILAKSVHLPPLFANRVYRGQDTSTNELDGETTKCDHTRAWCYVFLAITTVLAMALSLRTLTCAMVPTIPSTPHDIKEGQRKSRAYYSPYY
ncbi:hypothetical protein KAFR_0B03000 [Kazachstania africana CBS 2517]|uniref:Protein BIG1 n=1 Tax=Kazachstania africana (strain ATCC 22294 / BCRC 22015 / CBS 2517 / CECT 1963 / NBRC 1671 / NRRL Y-8276) TaxID=1071382 RepID=H2AQE6_KAZAF|nr:hypothetical protein KAFR_0B03000 [Kazachstania africana CBS 2517]CCF56596.1 hypothetical protein KAFR_0B03000 [Kazachstania africana CBS 2517]